jgi:hypothetical protein
VCHFLHFLPLCQCTWSSIQPTLRFLWKKKSFVLHVKPQMQSHFSKPQIWNKNPSNPNFYRSKHAELTRREVQTIRRMVQDLEFQISDRPLKSLASSMRMGHCCAAKLQIATIVLFALSRYLASVHQLKKHSSIHKSPFHLSPGKF